MSKAEAFEVKFAGNRSINVEVNFSKGDAIKVPVNINSMDADKLAQKIADQLQLPEIDTTNIASKDLEKFFGVKPIEGYEFMTAEEVCSELEEIMTSMDLELTQEQAKEITNNTLNKG
jgi:hypothetical protein